MKKADNTPQHISKSKQEKLVTLRPDAAADLEIMRRSGATLEQELEKLWGHYDRLVARHNKLERYAEHVKKDRDYFRKQASRLTTAKTETKSPIKSSRKAKSKSNTNSDSATKKHIQHISSALLSLSQKVKITLTTLSARMLDATAKLLVTGKDLVQKKATLWAQDLSDALQKNKRKRDELSVQKRIAKNKKLKQQSFLNNKKYAQKKGFRPRRPPMSGMFLN